MSDFYQLSSKQQAERLEQLARKALQHYPISDDAQLKLIKHRENAVFEVIDGDQRYALRVHRQDYHCNAALFSELQWMNALNSLNGPVSTPKVIAANDGGLMQIVSIEGVPQPRQIDLLNWVHGAPIGTIEDGIGDVDEAASVYRHVGELVAHMHNFTEQWPLPEGFKRHAWDSDAFLSDEPFWGRYWELETLNDEQRQILADAAAKARTELAGFGQAKDRYGLIHADTLPENFLRDADGTIRVIDFDDGGFGWHMFDFATALFFLLGEDCFDALLEAMVEGYRQHRQLSDEQLDMLNLFLLLRGLTYLGWVHTRKETETAQQVTPMLTEGVPQLAQAYLSQ